MSEENNALTEEKLSPDSGNVYPPMDEPVADEDTGEQLSLADAVKKLYQHDGDIPEQTTRQLAEGNPPIVDGIPLEKKKAVLG